MPSLIGHLVKADVNRILPEETFQTSSPTQLSWPKFHRLKPDVSDLSPNSNQMQCFRSRRQSRSLSSLRRWPVHSSVGQTDDIFIEWNLFPICQANFSPTQTLTVGRRILCACLVYVLQPLLCKVILCVKMYSSMSSINWMFIEGLLLHSRLTTSIFRKDAPFPLYYAIGWGEFSFSRSLH